MESWFHRRDGRPPAAARPGRWSRPAFLERLRASSLAILFAGAGSAARGETLSVEGEITSFIARDRDGDGLLEAWVSYHRDGQRFLGLFAGAREYGGTPERVVPIDAQAVIFSLGDHDAAPGLELVLYSRSSAVLYPLAGGEESARRLFATDLFFGMPSRRELPAWLPGSKLDLDGDRRDDFVLPEKQRLRILLSSGGGAAAPGVPQDSGIRPVAGSAPASEWGRAVELPVRYYLLTGTREEAIQAALEDFVEEDKSPAPLLKEEGAFPFPLIADFDGDGRLDVVVKQAGQRLDVFRQRPGGAFPGAADLSVKIGWASDATSLELLDLNGDRRLDAVAAELLLKDLATEVKVFVQDAAQPDSGFRQPRQVIRVQGFFRRPDLADADGDRRPDLLVSTYRLDLLDQLKKSAVEEIEITHEVFAGAAEQPFERRPSYQRQFTLRTRELERERTQPFLHAGRDLTGDGVPDILFLDGASFLRLYRGLGGRPLRYEEEAAFTERVERPLDLGMADLDSRGGEEVILRYQRRLQIHRFEGMRRG